MALWVKVLVTSLIRFPAGENRLTGYPLTCVHAAQHTSLPYTYFITWTSEMVACSVGDGTCWEILTRSLESIVEGRTSSCSLL